MNTLFRNDNEFKNREDYPSQSEIYFSTNTPKTRDLLSHSLSNTHFKIDDQPAPSIFSNQNEINDNNNYPSKSEIQYSETKREPSSLVYQTMYDKYISVEKFKNLIQKNLQNFKLINPNERKYAFEYLDQKDINAFKMVPEEDRYYVFHRLENKDIQSFKLVPENDLHRVFKYLDKKDIDCFKLLPIKYRYEAFQYLDKTTITTLDDFNAIPEQYQNEIFIFVDKNLIKTLEDFKSVKPQFRHEVFHYLDIKDVEAFKIIQENHRCKFFNI